MKLPRIFLISVVLLLTACGFHLSGTEFPVSLKKMYFVSNQPYSEFTRMLKQTLSTEGVQLVNMPNEAPVTLRLLSTRVSSTQTSVGSDQETRQYALTFTASFEMQNAKGEVVVGPMSLSSIQNITMLSGVLIENTNQFTTTQQIAERDVLHRILDILQAPNTQKKLAS